MDSFLGDMTNSVVKFARHNHSAPSECESNTSRGSTCSKVAPSMSTLTSPPPAYSPRPDVTDSSDHDSITLVASDNGSDCPTGSSDAGSVTSCEKKPPKEKPHEQKPSDGKKLREKQPKALETIMEDAAVQTCPNHQPAQKICGRRQCFWMIIVASLLFVIGFVISWTQRQKQ
jgi:hypothetical protein